MVGTTTSSSGGGGHDDNDDDDDDDNNNTSIRFVVSTELLRQDILFHGHMVSTRAPYHDLASHSTFLVVPTGVIRKV